MNGEFEKYPMLKDEKGLSDDFGLGVMGTRNGLILHHLRERRSYDMPMRVDTVHLQRSTVRARAHWLLDLWLDGVLSGEDAPHFRSGEIAPAGGPECS